MKVLVNGKIKELSCIINGVDCASDFHGNASNESKWNNDEECWEMKVANFEWWQEYFMNKEKDEELKQEIIKEHGIEAWQEAFEENFFANEMEYEHDGMRAVFEVFER